MSDMILLYKFVSGEEVIAKCIEEEDGRLTLKNPTILVPDPQNPGQLGFAPWFPFAEKGENNKDSKVYINADHILATAEPLENIVRSYREVYGEIQIATANVITK